MAEEGQKAWQAWIDGCQIYPRTPFKDIDGELKIAWQFVERTITNEALRRAAEVAAAHKGAAKRARLAKNMKRVPPEALYEIYAEENGEDIASGLIAAAIRTLIKEPGHE